MPLKVRPVSEPPTAAVTKPPLMLRNPKPIFPEPTAAVGSGKIGLGFRNINGGLVTAAVGGSETGLTFNGIYESAKGRFGAIVGRVSSRNTTTMNEGGFLAFLTKG